MPEPMRSIDEVGRGDFVKVGTTWKKITSITPGGRFRRDQTIRTADGCQYNMGDINRYGKAEDFS